MNLQHRIYTPELLDRPDIPFDDIRVNMRELDTINTWLGGHDITITGIRKLAGKASVLHVCEIGCGGGDNLRAIGRWARLNGIRLRATGIDIKPECIQYAQTRNYALAEVEWICADYKDLRFDEKPDIIYSSLFCHHFGDAGVAEIFRWSLENSRLGFFMNDLQRHPLAYHSIKILTGLFSRSYLVKNDAPLSVARGFKRQELKALLREGIGERAIRSSLYWKWAFRWLLICRHD